MSSKGNISENQLNISGAEVTKTLSTALQQEIRKYKKFAASDTNCMASKDFQAHHAACKAALQHIELLMKLASSLNVKKSPVVHNDIAALMEKADLELNTYKANVSDN